jgi:hypothetical protein
MHKLLTSLLLLASLAFSAPGDTVAVDTTAPEFNRITATGKTFYAYKPIHVGKATNPVLTGVTTHIGEGAGTAAPLSGLVIQSYGTKAGYLQNNIQNLSNDTAASADWVVSSNVGTDSTYYGDFGCNDSGFVQGKWTVNGKNDCYLYAKANGKTSVGGNLALGTADTGKHIDFFTGGTKAANVRLTIGDTQSTSVVPLVVPSLRSAPTTVTGKTNNDLWVDAMGRPNYQLAGLSLPGSVMLANSATATVTYSGITAETQFYTYTIPAAVFAGIASTARPVIKTRMMWGLTFGSSTSTATIKEKWNGVLVNQWVIKGNLTGGPTFAAGQAKPMDCYGQIKREGGGIAATTIRSHSDWTSSFTGTTKFGTMEEFSYGNVVVDGSVPIVVTFTLQWSANDSVLYFDQLQAWL